MRVVVRTIVVAVTGVLLICGGMLQSATVGEVITEYQVVQSISQSVDRPDTVIRARSGLQALYDFRSDSGAIIEDRSGVGEPVNLLIADVDAVRRSVGALEVLGETTIRSEHPPAKIIESIRWSGQFTIEAWVRPANTEQDGPARIITLSSNIGNRNFTLGQDGDQIDMRFRTSLTNTNGLPGLNSANQSIDTELTHIVYTRDRTGQARIYLNGEVVEEGTISGDVFNWSESYHLALANELDDSRPWLGTYHLAAIYNRALTPREVKQNFKAGTDIEDTPAWLALNEPSPHEQFFNRQVAPLMARQCFECHDASVREGGLDLSRIDEAFAGGNSGPAIVPGNADESLLWNLVKQDVMPLARPSLSSEEKELLREWIEAGAVWTTEVIDPALFSRHDSGEEWLQRLTAIEYIETVQSALGVDIEAEAREILPTDFRADGFSNTAYNLGIDLEHVEAYATLAELIVERLDAVEFAAQFSESQDLTDENMRLLIAEMGKWLLRGPLEEREVTVYRAIAMTVINEGGDFEETVGYIIEAMLQSPRFIYRIENQRGDGTTWPVDDYELASRLSYIIWGGPPDWELMDAAEAGELSDREIVAAQVERMLQDPRAVDRSLRFIYEWLDLDRLDNLRPNSDRFPNWEAQLAADMRDETLTFFHDIVWEQERPLWDLMNAQLTYATPLLAEHYNLDRNHASAPKTREPTSRPERVDRGLQALYTFEERDGDTIHDVSGAGEPIHLTIGAQSPIAGSSLDARWSDEGLILDTPTLIASDAPPYRMVDAILESGEITLEAWVTPANMTQTGPARILTLSSGTTNRNFTLGQSEEEYEVRFRSSDTNNNGMPGLSSSGAVIELQPTHVVYTRDGDGLARLYVNGLQTAIGEAGGDLSNWDDSFQLALGNELSNDRPWQGTLHLAAVYSRALSTVEVRQNLAAGARKQGPPALAGNSGLLALYKFDDGNGSRVHDSSDAGEALHLDIEDETAIEWHDDGLTVNASTLITAPESPQRLIDAIRATGELSLEAWITPANTTQDGPARILSLSSGTGERNFTLGQDGDQYEVRLRTEESDVNGLPALSSHSGSVEPILTHVAYTRNVAGEAKLYINGETIATHHDGGGNLSNWDDGFSLVFANETSKDRPWRGTLHSAAIYNRALTPEEVYSNSQSLLRFDLASEPSRGGILTHGSVLTVGGDEASMVTRGLFVLHDFLYSAVGNAPPGVDTTPIPTAPGLTQRRAAETRLADQSCMGCHARFEPLAFGLEKFDGLGSFFEVDEHGNELRDDGEILFPGAAEPIAYQTSAELMDLLAESERIRMNITRKVTQFAIGRPLVLEDAPIIEEIHETAKRNGGTYASLIKAIVMSDLVQMTKTERPPIASVE